MSEPSERNPIRGPYDAIRRIEEHDGHIRELRELRTALLKQFTHNGEAIQTGNWLDVVDYHLPNYIGGIYIVDGRSIGEIMSLQFKKLINQSTAMGYRASLI